MGRVSIWINEISLTICACHETIYFMLNFLCYSCSLPIGKKKVKLFSRVRLCDPMTVAYQAPPSMGFSRQEYWNGLPFPSPGDLPNPEIEPMSPALADRFFTVKPPGKPMNPSLAVPKPAPPNKLEHQLCVIFPGECFMCTWEKCEI